MGQISLISAHLRGGVWEGRLGPFETGSALPELEVRHQDRRLEGLLVARGDDGQTLTFRVALPSSVLSEGAQTVLLLDKSGHRLASLSLIAGDLIDADIRSEVDLLRAELDMLKRAFRRHCVETGADG